MDELSRERAIQLLVESRVGHLGVISRGEPYVSPISYVVLDDALYVRTGRGRRIDAVAESPRVCVEVSQTDPQAGSWESVIVWGEAEVVTDDRTEQKVIMAILEKYRDVMGSPLTPGSVFPDPGVVLRIPIEELSGRSSGSLFSAKSRPGRL
jgi:nitroimidazol reductase NimA-like FMN-containing flavoprotein (pyridoxamine 5'-phosphate oxidase superfamily)